MKQLSEEKFIYAVLVLTIVFFIFLFIIPIGTYADATGEHFTMEGVEHGESEDQLDMLSLKGFHIFFNADSILLGMFVGGWGVRQYLLNDQLGSLVLGAFFFVSAFILLAYGLKFIRKVDELGI